MAVRALRRIEQGDKRERACSGKREHLCPRESGRGSAEGPPPRKGCQGTSESATERRSKAGGVGWGPVLERVPRAWISPSVQGEASRGLLGGEGAEAESRTREPQSYLWLPVSPPPDRSVGAALFRSCRVVSLGPAQGTTTGCEVCPWSWRIPKSPLLPAQAALSHLSIKRGAGLGITRDRTPEAGAPKLGGREGSCA